MKNYYQILGVSEKASSEEIKKAYHKLAHRYHPDKGGDEKKFKEINEAYQVLSDKEKKMQYDRFGRVFEQGARTGAAAGYDFSSIWESFGQTKTFKFGGLEEILQEVFGFGVQTNKQDLRRGTDIEIDIEIPLQATLNRHERRVTLKKLISCSRCNGSGAEPGTSLDECSLCGGTGRVQQIKRMFFGTSARYVICPECQGEGLKPKRPCNVCKGEGRVQGKENISIVIPAGVDSNQIIELKGKGEAGRRGGNTGNLYVRIFVKPHPLFERRGDDIYIKIPISFSQAALGDKIEVPTLENKKILLKVPEGVNSGKVLRISGKGVPHFSGYGRGDLYVKLLVKTPEHLNKTQKELLKRLKEEGL